MGAAALAAVLLTGNHAVAQSDFSDTSRWYVGLGLGYHWPQTIDSHSTGGAPDGLPYHWLWQTSANAAVVGRLGYRLTPHVRVEIQSGYYNSSLNSVHAPGADVAGAAAGRPGEPYGLCSTTSPASRCVTPGRAPGNWTWMWTGMANAIYDILPDRRLDPFIGAGVGFAHLGAVANSYEFSGVPGTISSTNPAVQTLKDAGTLNRPSQLALQALAGLSYRLASHLNLDLTYYHYFTPAQLRWNPENNTPGLPAGDGLRPGDFLGRFQDDSVIVGVRYAF